MSLEDELRVAPDENGVYDSPILPVTAQEWPHWFHDEQGRAIAFFRKHEHEPPTESVMVLMRRGRDGIERLIAGCMTETFRHHAQHDGYGEFTCPATLSPGSVRKLFHPCDMDGCTNEPAFGVGQKWICWQHWREMTSGPWEV